MTLEKIPNKFDIMSKLASAMFLASLAFMPRFAEAKGELIPGLSADDLPDQLISDARADVVAMDRAELEEFADWVVLCGFGDASLEVVDQKCYQSYNRYYLEYGQSRSIDRVTTIWFNASMACKQATNTRDTWKGAETLKDCKKALNPATPIMRSILEVLTSISERFATLRATGK
jgi:hypothetical protein